MSDKGFNLCLGFVLICLGVLALASVVSMLYIVFTRCGGAA